MKDPNDTRDIGPRVGSPLWIHMSAVTVVGLAVFAWALAHLSGLAELVRHPLFWVIAALVVVGEMRPLVTQGRSGWESPVASVTFSFAALLYWGFPVAVLIRTTSCLVVGLAQRKAPHRCLFNAAQTTLSMAAAGLVLAVAGVHPAPGPALRALRRRAAAGAAGRPGLLPGELPAGRGGHRAALPGVAAADVPLRAAVPGAS